MNVKFEFWGIWIESQKVNLPWCSHTCLHRFNLAHQRRRCCRCRFDRTVQPLTPSVTCKSHHPGSPECPTRRSKCETVGSQYWRGCPLDAPRVSCWGCSHRWAAGSFPTQTSDTGPSRARWTIRRCARSGRRWRGRWRTRDMSWSIWASQRWRPSRRRLSPRFLPKTSRTWPQSCRTLRPSHPPWALSFALKLQLNVPWGPSQWTRSNSP